MKDDLTFVSGWVVLLAGLIGFVVLVAGGFYGVFQAWGTDALANAIARAVMLIVVAVLVGFPLMQIGEKIMRRAIYEQAEGVNDEQ